ncbi:hypothetical protein [Salinifilum ghardaiensis]
MNVPPRSPGQPDRRGVLRAAAALPAVVLGASAAATGCSGEDEPDPLLPLAEAAKSDAALARALGERHSELAAAAAEVADARSAHARALRREIERVHPPEADAPPTLPDVPAPEVSADAATGRQRLRRELERARDRAAEFVPNAPSNRAGLAGSVSASCASLLEVLT